VAVTPPESPCIYQVFIAQAYLTSQYVVPCGGIFLGKWRSSFAGSSDGKMNVQSACALNTRYITYYNVMIISNTPDSYIVNVLLKLVPFFVNISELECGFV
jgi:hypothetical protein